MQQWKCWYWLEFGSLRGFQDEAQLLTKLLGESRGQALVLVPHGGCCTLLEHTKQRCITSYNLKPIPLRFYSGSRKIRTEKLWLSKVESKAEFFQSGHVTFKEMLTAKSNTSVTVDSVPVLSSFLSSSFIWTEIASATILPKSWDSCNKRLKKLWNVKEKTWTSDGTSHN